MHLVNTVLNWSSGKDAALAYHLLKDGGKYHVSTLLTTLNVEHDRVFMHGLREQLLDMQAERMKLPINKVKLPPSPDDSLYKEAMKNVLTMLKKLGVTVAAFGDIFLEDLKLYREEQLSQAGMKATFPLWKMDTKELISIITEKGIEAIIVCVNERCLGKEYLGRKIDAAFLEGLPPDVDPCGENGEFHTFVYNAPYFSAPIRIKQGEIVYRNYATEGSTWDTGFYFLDILPA
ncbi:MAG: adenine nucleotide alpha hydrolase [Taibaiella sp.]|nr:adenine nucleotide alpha hydrolase [Taibaiella sp.]